MTETVMNILPIALPILGVVVLVIVLLCAMIKVARGNEALVVSGILATDKKGNPKIKKAGGSIVIPFIQRAKYFDLCVRTAERSNDVTKTKTGVPVVIDWAISYNPDCSSPESLQSAVRQFLDKDERSMEEIIMNVISGGVRAVISNMTPIQVMTGKDTLDEEVQKNIADQMAQLGFTVILTIQEVRDPDGSTYFEDIAAEDRETTRCKAANITAENDQAIREKAAQAEKAAKSAELESEVQIAEAQKDADIKKATFEAETSRKQVIAENAGALQEQEVKKELATKEGAAEVERQRQANEAAKARQEVAVTEAETEKRKCVIEAEAQAEMKKKEADGEAEATRLKAVGEAEAEATKVTRAAEAEATKMKAIAEAEAAATERRAEAEAKATEVRGKADATAIAVKGKAEAEAVEARGKAEAEAARLLSDAQAANDRVNFEIEKLEIETRARVEIATNVATVMAEVGKNAKFYDFGGSGSAGAGVDGSAPTDLLTRIMSNIPGVFAKADMENQALQDEGLVDTMEKIISSIVGPIKGSGGKDDAQITDDLADDEELAGIEAQSGSSVDDDGGDVDAEDSSGDSDADDEGDFDTLDEDGDSDF